MKTKKLRFSPQRDLVLQIVLDANDHLSAEEIYKRAKKKMPKISFGTVYRNLGQLEEEKKISKTEGPQKILVYEPFAEPHHHFICESCQSIRNVDNPTVPFCFSCLSDVAHTPFQVRTVSMTLYGICATCQTPQNRPQKSIRDGEAKPKLVILKQ